MYVSISYNSFFGLNCITIHKLRYLSFLASKCGLFQDSQKIPADQYRITLSRGFGADLPVVGFHSTVMCCA